MDVLTAFGLFAVIANTHSLCPKPKIMVKADQPSRGLQYTPKFLPMHKIEAAVPSDRVETVTNAIARAANTDDGKIFVFDLEHEAHMRMGEVEKAAGKLVSRRAA